MTPAFIARIVGSAAMPPMPVPAQPRPVLLVAAFPQTSGSAAGGRAQRYAVDGRWLESHLDADAVALARLVVIEIRDADGRRWFGRGWNRGEAGVRHGRF